MHKPAFGSDANASIQPGTESTPISLRNRLQVCFLNPKLLLTFCKMPFLPTQLSSKCGGALSLLTPF